MPWQEKGKTRLGLETIITNGTTWQFPADIWNIVQSLNWSPCRDQVSSKKCRTRNQIHEDMINTLAEDSPPCSTFVKKLVAEFKKAEDNTDYPGHNVQTYQLPTNTWMPIIAWFWMDEWLSINSAQYTLFSDKDIFRFSMSSLFDSYGFNVTSYHRCSWDHKFWMFQFHDLVLWFPVA